MGVMSVILSSANNDVEGKAPVVIKWLSLCTLCS